MPAPHRRAKAYMPGGILPSERTYFRRGRTFGEVPPPRWMDPDTYAIDEAAARAQWAEFRDEITADHAPWTPWAARTFDGAPGDVSKYGHLRPPDTKEHP